MVGSVARIRVSSVTLPFSIGTLRSSRRRTSSPALRSRSVTVVTFTMHPAPSALGSLAELADPHGQIDHPVWKSPLVVVPAEPLPHGVAQDHGERQIGDRAVGVPHEVARDDRLLAHREDVLHRPPPCRLHRVVYPLAAPRL